jgi:hypothetical protein
MSKSHITIRTKVDNYSLSDAGLVRCTECTTAEDSIFFLSHAGPDNLMPPRVRNGGVGANGANVNGDFDANEHAINNQMALTRILGTGTGTASSIRTHDPRNATPLETAYWIYSGHQRLLASSLPSLAQPRAALAPANLDFKDVCLALAHKWSNIKISDPLMPSDPRPSACSANDCTVRNGSKTSTTIWESRMSRTVQGLS